MSKVNELDAAITSITATPMPLHCRRQQPDQRGQDRPVGPVQARPRVPAPQNRDLVS
jgi:hypothetical protein